VRLRHARAFALLVIFATMAIAGCGGGGKSSLPAVPAQQLGAKVPVTFTVTIGTPPTTQSSARKPAYIPTSAQSLVIEYIGAANSSAPSATPPSNVTTAATVNVTTSGTNPPPVGTCYNNAGSYICTISVQLPLGIIDLYILAYTGTNGSGSLLASSVTAVQVNSNASLTQPGTTTTVTINTLGAVLGSVALNAISAIVPLGLPNPSVAATSYPNNAAPNVYSAAGTATFKAPDGSTISGNVAISPVTITDSENGGATCLVYIAQGASSATPCPFASAASSVTLNNAGDSYAILYNGRFVPNASVIITASGGPSPAPSPLAVPITPTIFSTGSIAFSSGSPGPIGALVYDAVGKAVYAGIYNPSAPLYAVPYSSTTGYGTPAAVNVMSVNGVAATSLSGNGGTDAMVIGPDGNAWIAEHDSRGSNQYLAVAVLHSAVVNPAGPSGSMIQPGAGVFAEYQLAGPGRNLNAAAPLHSIASMGGYIWVMDKDGDLWRINPSTGLVSPNLAAGYLPGQTITQATRVTDPGDTVTISGSGGDVLYSPLFALGSSLYIANDRFSSLDTLTVDTSASPSAGVCSPSGPPPCIAAYSRSLAGVLRQPYLGGGTDGTSLYTVDAATGQVFKVTPGSSVATSASAFASGYRGGVGIAADGWLWTLSSSGVEAIPGISSTASAVTPTSLSGCNTLRNLKRGSTPIIIGPDGTVLFSPNTSGSTNPTAAVVCAVVY